MIHAVGSVNIDHVARLQTLPAPPRPGATVMGRALEKTPDGGAAAAAVWLRALSGADPRGPAASGPQDAASATVIGHPARRQSSRAPLCGSNRCICAASITTRTV